MKQGNRLRVLVLAAGVAASLLAVSARPALAASEGDSGAWSKVYGLQDGYAPFSCQIHAGNVDTPDHWSCSTTSTGALNANGQDCTQTVYANVAFRTVGLPVMGCIATLSNVAWSGDAACADVCHADGALGTATFTFQPVIGAPIVNQNATISDATCSAAAGHASVAAEGIAGGSTYEMTGTISWVGSCTDTSLLTWAGTVTIV